MATISGNTVTINGETTYLPISSRRLTHIDRKWPGRHMYCSKHNYGRMDSWYNCGECCNETRDEFEAHQASDEYKEGWQLISEHKFTEGHPKIICPSRRKILRYYKMSTIQKKESRANWQRPG